MGKQVVKSLLFSSVVLLSFSGGYVFANGVEADVTSNTITTAEQISTSESLPNSEVETTIIESETVSTEVVTQIVKSEGEEINSASELEVVDNATKSISEETPEEISVESYRENVTTFPKVTIEELYNAFTADNQEHTIYIGRETCYYCRQFSPELKKFNQLTNERLEYYNTDGDDFDEEARTFLYETVGIPGVPTILYVKNGALTSAWVGGGIAAQELYDHLYFDIAAIRVNEEAKDVPSEISSQTGKSNNDEYASTIGERSTIVNAPLGKISEVSLSDGSSEKTKQSPVDKILTPTVNKTQITTLSVGIKSNQALPQAGEDNRLVLMQLVGSLILLFLAILLKRKRR